MAESSGFKQFNTDTMNELLEGVVRRLDDISGSRLSRLLSTTALVQPSELPFADYGFIVAAGSRPLPITSQIRDIAIFTVEEARERISSFIEGRFHPDTLADLFEYLQSKFLRIETRTLPGGKTANYLVDVNTKKEVPAAQVDPRLSHRRLLALSLRPAVKDVIGRGAAPTESFRSWEGMKMAFESHPRGIGYTVFDGKAFVGEVHAVASSDPRENMEIIRTAREAGTELIVPVIKDGRNGPNVIVPGMPMLVKVKSIPAEEIHPGLSHAVMSKAFGRGMPQTFLRLAASVKPRTGEEAVEDARAALDAFVRKSPDAFDEMVRVDDRAVGFGGLGDSDDLGDPAHYVIRRVGGASPYLYVHDVANDSEPGIRVGSLPEGRYRRENEAGMLEGYTEVLSDCSLRHTDLRGRPCRPVPTPAAAPRREVREAYEPDAPAYAMSM